MTVASEVSRSGPYNGNGVTTVFDYDFKIVDRDHLRVIKSDASGDEVTLTIDADYDVAGVGASEGSITTFVAPVTGETITILRNVPLSQETDLENQGPYFAETIEAALDLSAMRDQQLQEQLTRAVLVPASSDNSGGELAAQLALSITRLADSADEIDVVAGIKNDVEAVAEIAGDVALLADVSGVLSGTASAVRMDEKMFTGNGVVTSFALDRAPGVKENVLVWIGGAIQDGSDYSVSGSTLTIAPAVANGVEIRTLIMTLVTANDITVLRDQAQAAADLAASYGKYDFAMEAAFKAASVPLVVQYVVTAGYYAPGDGGGHRKVRIAAPGVIKPWHAQSSDGAWWQVAEGQDVHVEMFGAVRRTSAELVTLNGAASLDADEAKNEIAFQASNDFMEAKGGGTFYGKGNVYLFGTKGWRYSRAVYFEGAGHGKWMPSFPTEVKTWEGTNLIPRKTGAKDYIARGVTSGEYSGGWRTSLDTPARKFKLTSFMNRDALGNTAATPKQMSVFIAPKARSQDKGGIRNCRIVPWIGTDGISTYSTQAGSDLGANWDIGLMLDTVEGFHVKGVQVRGYWRMVGLPEVSPDFEGWSRSEANIIEDSSATGFVGMMVRSGPQHRVLSTSWSGTVGTVEIAWDAENPFPSTGGQINLINAGYVQYTSTSRNGGNLVFNGLTVNPTGNTYLRNPYRGTGFSTGAFINVEAWGLWHHSGQKAEALGFDRPSTGFECSGFPMRGLNFFNFSAFGEDSISPAMHLHNCFDFNFTGGKAEVGIVLASPIEASQELPATSAGSTNNIRLIGFQFASSVDRRLGYWNPRSTMDLQRQWNDLDDLTSATMLLKALEGQEFWLKMAASKNFRLKKDDGSDALTVFASGNATFSGSLTVGTTGTALINSTSGFGIALREGTTTRLQAFATSGNIAPGADNAQALGTSGLRWSQLYAGTATINTSDERLKREIEAIEEKVLDAWGDVEWKQYRFTDGARLHFGLVAQRVEEAFSKRGLDAFDLGLLCFDEWDDQFDPVFEQVEVSVPVFGADGEEVGHTIEHEYVDTGKVRLVVKAGNRYGLRYEECFAIEAAYQRRRLDKLEALLMGKQN